MNTKINAQSIGMAINASYNLNGMRFKTMVFSHFTKPKHRIRKKTNILDPDALSQFMISHVSQRWRGDQELKGFNIGLFYHCFINKERAC